MAHIPISNIHGGVTPLRMLLPVAFALIITHRKACCAVFNWRKEDQISYKYIIEIYFNSQPPNNSCGGSDPRVSACNFVNNNIATIKVKHAHY